MASITARQRNDLVELCAEAAQIWKDSNGQELPATYIVEKLHAALKKFDVETASSYDLALCKAARAFVEYEPEKHGDSDRDQASALRYYQECLRAALAMAASPSS